MKRFFSVLLCFLTLFLFACQRFEQPAKREGLDKDSHSYTYISYPESSMKQIAMDIEGVEDVRIEYNRNKIMMYILPATNIHPSKYRKMANLVYKKVNQVTPVNPFHVVVVPPEKWMETPY